MAFGVETIGNYDVTRLSDGRYSVALNNGNCGAKVCTEAEVQALRDKYNKNLDTFERSDKPTFSKAQAEQIMLLCTNPFVAPMIMTSPLFKDAGKALQYYKENPSEVQSFEKSDKPTLTKEQANLIMLLCANPLAAPIVMVSPLYRDAVKAIQYYKKAS